MAREWPVGASIETMPSSQYDGVQHVVHLSTNIGKSCEQCQTFLDNENLAGAINHYLTKHEYTLLHTGQETIHGSDGKPWHTTVAVVGK